MEQMLVGAGIILLVCTIGASLVVLAMDYLKGKK
jgi:hypothetical protein